MKLPILRIQVSTLQSYPYFTEIGIVVNLNQGINRAVRNKDRRCLKYKLWMNVFQLVNQHGNLQPMRKGIFCVCYDALNKIGLVLQFIIKVKLKPTYEKWSICSTNMHSFVLFFSETLKTEIIIKPFFIQALYPFW